MNIDEGYIHGSLLSFYAIPGVYVKWKVRANKSNFQSPISCQVESQYMVSWESSRFHM